MPRFSFHRPQTAGHVLVPAAAISGLSIALAAGLEAFGVHNLTNAAIARFVSRGGAEGFANHLPESLVWLAAAAFAFGLPFTILSTPGNARRAGLWITTGFLVAAWAPVLSLAAYQPDISAAWIATVWSGVCALVYAANHRMPCDTPPPNTP